jgi:hypothetical protein
MSLIRPSQPCSPSSEHNPIPDLQVLTSLIDRKAQRKWQIDSRQSTPELFHPKTQSIDALAYWKALAGQNESLVRGLDASTDHRRSIDSAEYWEMEARHLIAVYWSIIQQRQKGSRRPQTGCRHGRTTKAGKSTLATDGPISSRLRSSQIKDNRPSSRIVKSRRTRQLHVSKR